MVGGIFEQNLFSALGPFRKVTCYVDAGSYVDETPMKTSMKGDVTKTALPATTTPFPLTKDLAMLTHLHSNIRSKAVVAKILQWDLGGARR